MTYSIKKQRTKRIEVISVIKITISVIKITISSSSLSHPNFQHKAELHLAKKSVRKGKATMSLTYLACCKAATCK
jgi:hypothetical protein